MSRTQDWLDSHTGAVSTLASVLEDPDHTRRFAEQQARKIVAHAAMVIALLGKIEDPKSGGLRQQRTLDLDDQDQLLEELEEASRRVEWARDHLRRLGSPHVDSFDPDERDAVQEADRARQDRQAEAAGEVRL